MEVSKMVTRDEHRAVTVLHAATVGVHDLWPAVETHGPSRQIVRLAERALRGPTAGRSGNYDELVGRIGRVATEASDGDPTGPAHRVATLLHAELVVLGLTERTGVVIAAAALAANVLAALVDGDQPRARDELTLLTDLHASLPSGLELDGTSGDLTDDGSGR